MTKGNNMSFEENLDKLESLVKSLENGDIALDDAILKYQEAMKLAKVCDEKLKKAEDAITKIVKEDGTLEDFDVKED